MRFLVIAPRTRAWILAAFLFFVSSILRAALWRKTAVARSLTNRFRSITPCHQYCWIEQHQRLKLIERISTHNSYTVLRKQVSLCTDVPPFSWGRGDVCTQAKSKLTQWSTQSAPSNNAESSNSRSDDVAISKQKATEPTVYHLHRKLEILIGK